MASSPTLSFVSTFIFDHSKMKWKKKIMISIHFEIHFLDQKAWPDFEVEY